MESPRTDEEDSVCPSYPITRGDLRKFAKLAVNRRVTLSELVAKREAEFANSVEKIAADINSITSIPVHQRQAAIREKSAEVRKNFVRNNESAFLEHVHAALADAETAKSIAPLFASPIIMASQSDFTEKRGQMFAEMSSWGPAALANAATRAKLTGNKDMTAALVSIVDKMPAKNRPFNTAELADAVFGAECREMSSLCQLVGHEAKLAENAYLSFTRGQRVRNGALALDERDMGGVRDELLKDEAPAVEPAPITAPANSDFNFHQPHA